MNYLVIMIFAGFSLSSQWAISAEPNSEGWVRCASEWRICSVPVPATVRYGIAGKYIERMVSVSIHCSNHRFGNPAPVVKHCDYLLSDTADYDGDGVVDRQDRFPNNRLEWADTDGDGLGNSRDPFPEDASNANHLAWVRCSSEFFTCVPPVPAVVRYGHGEQYYYRQTNGTIWCNNTTFGNPIATRKHCDYLLSDTADYDYDGDGVVDRQDSFPNNPTEMADSDEDGIGDNSDPFPQDASNEANAGWIRCAQEWHYCQLSLPVIVRYGIEGHYVYQRASSTIRCANAVFGNSAIGGKHCDYLLSDTADYDGDGVVDRQDPFPNNSTEMADSDEDGIGDNSDPFPQDATNEANADWIHCAQEWHYCQLPQTAMVRYGIEGQYLYQQAIGTIRCANVVFGNPALGVKHCDYLMLPDPLVALDISLHLQLSARLKHIQGHITERVDRHSAMRGELQVTTITTGSSKSSQWDIFFDDESPLQAAFPEPLSLYPGHYRFDLSLVQGNIRYLGTSTLDVQASNEETMLDMVLHPVIEGNDIDAGTTSQFPLRLSYPSESLANLSRPQVGLRLNDGDEYIFSIEPTVALSESFILATYPGDHQLTARLFDGNYSAK